MSLKGLLCLVISFVSLGASLCIASNEAMIQELSDSYGGELRMSYHSGTGKVRFIGAGPHSSIPQPFSLEPGATPEMGARVFLNKYGGLFGLSDPAKELSLNKAKDLPGGRSVAKFKQLHHSLPVLGGEIVVNMDQTKSIRSVNGEVSPEIILDTTPGIDAEAAGEKALGMVSLKYSIPTDSLSILSSELAVYNPVLLGYGMNKNFLVWKLIIRSDQPPRSEFVLIDAKSGRSLLSFNQIDTALYRKMYDNNNDKYAGLPGYGPVRVEGNGPTGNDDVDEAYQYLGDTYNFYHTYFGRDSVDGQGMNLVATVRYCDSNLADKYCPYRNAFWNGTQMVFGEGFAAADDVVAHELTHAVTESESHLFYIMQSGAINESISDVFGELIDQWNGRGTDTPEVKWLMGEDVPGIGAIRNMKNPPEFKNPDSMLSSFYSCKDTDNGGVHINSGVNNKAAYLMTDGDTFNGYTIHGLGIEKVAKIYYEVQTNFLTSGSDYQDLADALYQACLNLTGDGTTTTSDCNEVLKAISAVHMEALPPKCKNIDPALCSSGPASNIFFDDFESTPWNKWVKGGSGSDKWYYPQNPNNEGLDATYAKSGEHNIWGADNDYSADYYIAMSASYLLPPSGDIFMYFSHFYAFEYGKTGSGTTVYVHGGVIEYSANDGPWLDAGDLMVVNGYNNKINQLYGSYYGNNLAGRVAFVGTGPGYISTKLNLSSLAGQNVKFRFRIGTTSLGYSSLGWFIDDVRIYTCSSPDPASMVLAAPHGGETFSSGETTTIQWSGPSNTAYSTLSYSTDNGATWKTIEKYLSGWTYEWIVPVQTANKPKSLIKVTGYDSNGKVIGSDGSNSPFAIEVVKLTAPNGGENWASGTGYNITWTPGETKNPVSSAKLSYSLDNGTTWKLITTVFDTNQRTYPWTIPTDIKGVKDKCKVKVQLFDSHNASLGNDLSDAPFTIQGTN